MSQPDDPIGTRDGKCHEIADAFRAASVCACCQHMSGTAHSEVASWLNYGYGSDGRRGQRRVLATVDGEGVCRVYLSRLHHVPEGKSGDEVLLGEPSPLVFTLPAGTSNLGDEVVRRVLAVATEG